MDKRTMQIDVIGPVEGTELMKCKMKKLKVEHFNHPLNRMMGANFRIVEDDSTQFSVCNLGLSSLEQQPAALLKKQEGYAKLLAAAPELLQALQGMLEQFDYNEQPIYSFAAKEIDAAKAAIKKAIE